MTARRVKLPSFQFYPGDWLRDAGLRACTAASRGVWMDLLCFMHDSPVRGHLLKANGQPFTDAELSRALGCTPAQLRRHLAELESAGVFDRNAQGVIVSRRMASDEDARRQAVENGKKGGNPELLRTKPEGLPEVSHAGQPDANRGVNPTLNRGVGDGISPSSSSASSSASAKQEEETPNSPPGGGDGPTPARKRPPAKAADPEADPRFRLFWQDYPKKVAKPEAARAFARLAPSDELLAVLLAALARQRASPDWARDGGKFIPHPATWLNQRRWEDAPPEVAAPAAGAPGQPPSMQAKIDEFTELARSMGLAVADPDPAPGGPS